ncbi:MAG: extracellular solute-binding protein [Pseudomonadota bacterium]
MNPSFPFIFACATLATAATAEVTISHGYSAFGDLKYPADFAHLDYANPDAPKDGTMTQRQLYGTPTFDSLNIFIIKGDSASEIAHHLYDSLMVRAYDEPDAVYGLVAETIEYPEDLSYITFNLRPEAQFQDGEALTASDVVFTLNALKTEGHPYYRNLLANVEDVVAENDHRVRLDLAEGAGSAFPGTVAELPILPEHFYDETPFDESWMTIPVGSGPYIIDRVDVPRSIKFCRDPNYWAANLPMNVGRNNFDCFAYEYFADETVGLEAFAAGEYQMRVEYRSANWANGYEFPAAQKGWVKKMLLPDARPANAQGVWINMRRPILQDIRVRQALGYAFNFEWTNETLFYNAYSRSDSFFENTEMQATGLPDAAELALLEPYRDSLASEVFVEPPSTPYVSGTNPRDRGALRAASALLDEAGWIAGDDGIRRNADGEPLQLSFPEDSRGIERVMLPFVENLQSLGIEANLEMIDPSAASERLQQYDFDLASVSWRVPVNPGAGLRGFYGSEAAASEGSNNLTGLADPVVDELIETVAAAENRDDLIVAVRALDRVLRSQHIWIPGWHSGDHRVAVWDIFGIPETPAPYDFNRGVDFWWFDRDKYAALVAEGALPDEF